MDRSGRVFDGRLRPVPPDQDAVRDEGRGLVVQDRRARIGSAAGSRVAPSIIWSTSSSGRPAASAARPARHRFRDPVEIGDAARSVRAEQGVANRIERDLDAFRFGERRLFRQFPFDGVTERARQPVAVEAIREQIVARARPDDLPRDLFILVRADDEDRDGWARPGAVSPTRRCPGNRAAADRATPRSSGSSSVVPGRRTAFRPIRRRRVRSFDSASASRIIRASVVFPPM